MTSIIQFADIHFGTEDKAAIAALSRVIDSLEPDIILICGDLTQNGKLAEFEEAAKWVDGLPGPKIITPGNHDTPMFGIIQRVIDPFGRYNKIIAPLSEASFEDEHVVLAPFNTSRGWQFKFDWSLGVVDLPELSRLTRWMNKADDKFKAIISHHPFIYPPMSPIQKDTKRGPQGLELGARLGLNAIFTGHTHASFTTEHGGNGADILSIGAGTLSTRRRDKPASFNHIRIDGEFAKVDFLEWEYGEFRRGHSHKIIRQARTKALQCTVANA